MQKTIEKYQEEILQLIKDGKYNDARELKDEMRKAARMELINVVEPTKKSKSTNGKVKN